MIARNKFFSLVKEKDSKVSKFLEQINFVHVPGKTDDFIVFSSLDSSKVRPEIIVHTKRRLANYKENYIPETLARKTGYWSYEEILDSQSLALLKLPSPRVVTKERVERILAYDKVTEGDSLRFFNYVASSSINMPEEFWCVMVLWLCDEMNHCAGFKTAYSQLFGINPEREITLDIEKSDFIQFNSIMKDSFKLLVALTYDEASTINGYIHDLPIYQQIGQPLSNFVRRVNADESWHFSKFANLLVKYFPERIYEIPEILEEVKLLDGRPYNRTFLLDHDPSIEAQFTKAAQDKACSIVLKVLNKKANKQKRRC
jgi:hypothetical protein